MPSALPLFVGMQRSVKAPQPLWRARQGANATPVPQSRSVKRRGASVKPRFVQMGLTNGAYIDKPIPTDIPDRFHHVSPNSVDLHTTRLNSIKSRSRVPALPSAR